MENTKLNRLILIGASGHGKVIADIARLIGYSDIVFLDNNLTLKECAGYPVLGPDTLVDEIEGDVFIAVGNAAVRKKLMEKYYYRSFPILIHPCSVVASDVVIGVGSAVMAGAIINSGTVIGKGCIINTSSSVDHDCRVGDYCHISVGSHLCGTVCVEEETWIGAGAIVSNNTKICGRCMIGAGAVVISDISDPGTYVGIPTKKKNGECK